MTKIIKGSHSDDYFISCWSMYHRRFFFPEISIKYFQDLIDNGEKSNFSSFLLIDNYLLSKFEDKWKLTDIRIKYLANSLHKKSELREYQYLQFLQLVRKIASEDILLPNGQHSVTYKASIESQFIIKLYDYLYKVDKRYDCPPVIQISKYFSSLTKWDANPVQKEAAIKFCEEFTSDKYPEQIRLQAKEALKK